MKLSFQNDLKGPRRHPARQGIIIANFQAQRVVNMTKGQPSKKLPMFYPRIPNLLHNPS
jgi:hypothetical protein